MKRIYLSPPHLNGGESNLLLEAFASNWITTLGRVWMRLKWPFVKKVGPNMLLL